MYNVSDYKCEICQKIIEQEKEYGKDFPTQIICECGGNAPRSFSMRGPVFIVPEHMKATFKQK